MYEYIVLFKKLKSMKNIIIASTSTVHDSDYLEYLLDELKVFFKDVNTILFIPYARPSGISHDTYTEKVKEAFISAQRTMQSKYKTEPEKWAAFVLFE